MHPTVYKTWSKIHVYYIFLSSGDESHIFCGGCKMSVLMMYWLVAHYIFNWHSIDALMLFSLKIKNTTFHPCGASL